MILSDPWDLIVDAAEIVWRPGGEPSALVALVGYRYGCRWCSPCLRSRGRGFCDSHGHPHFARECRLADASRGERVPG